MSDLSSAAKQERIKKSPQAKKSPKKSPRGSPGKNAKRGGPRAAEGVLANLPRTRPQRSTVRRDAARRAAPERKAESAPSSDPSRTSAPAPSPSRTTPLAPTRKAKAKPSSARASATKAQASPASASKQARTKPRRAKVTRPAKPLQDPAPRQGFETERDPVRGPVQPPGGVDLFASAAELAGELAKTGLSSGGRLLKDVFGRLPLN